MFDDDIRQSLFELFGERDKGSEGLPGEIGFENGFHQEFAMLMRAVTGVLCRQAS